jgi:hypothetical protein
MSKFEYLAKYSSSSESQKKIKKHSSGNLRKFADDDDDFGDFAVKEESHSIRGNHQC